MPVIRADRLTMRRFSQISQVHQADWLLHNSGQLTGFTTGRPQENSRRTAGILYTIYRHLPLHTPFLLYKGSSTFPFRPV
ncbi:hypothetical protein AB833_10635 [Chromatiales bacterium (ex Bugula neritina AB1)]|nr:hypothetical protein AB833_10635 [Chromatiales bacterium (ex Bugula neritina AB1)]